MTAIGGLAGTLPFRVTRQAAAVQRVRYDGAVQRKATRWRALLQENCVEMMRAAESVELCKVQMAVFAHI